ncbi:MAG: hypothetical protein WC511_02095 [Candidatus Pacearchaeota archaeon]
MRNVDLTVEDILCENSCQAVVVSGVVTLSLYEESNYGADYDGRRGMPRLAIEDYEIAGINILRNPSLGKIRVIKYESLKEKNKRRVEKVLYTEAKRHLENKHI